MTRAYKMLVWGMFLLIIIYNSIDAYQTYWLIQVGFTESNPIVNYFIGVIGLIPALAAVKASMLLVLLITIILTLDQKGA